MSVSQLNESTMLPTMDAAAESHPMVLINSFASLLALMGTIGNFLSFRSAEYLPEATSKYLMKYLAICDSLAALSISVVRQAINNFVIPRLRVSY